MRFHRDDFFSGYRAAFGPMQQLQVDGLNSLLDNIEEDPEWQSVPQVSYFLATIKHETGVTVNKVLQTFQPIMELRERKTSPRRANQDRYWLTGFQGRGYCQITWKENYQKFAVATGVDLVAEPDRALEPEIAYLIASTGMREGLFTEVALSDFVNGEADYRNARKVVNGLDKADLIASYARKFQKILEASEIGDEEPTRHHASKPVVHVSPDAAPPADDAAVKTVEGQPPTIEVQPRETSIVTKVAAGASAVGPAVAAAGAKLGGIQIPPQAWYAVGAIIIVGMVLAAWIWNEAQKRRSTELQASMNNLASKDRLNVVAADSKA